MLTVHHLENSRSHRILWLLEELGMNYQIEHYDRDPETQLAPDELREIHPLGKSPIVTDGGETVAESGAIIEYILDEYGDGRLRPEQGSEAYRRYRYWMHYAEGSAMMPLVLQVIFSELPRQSPWPLSTLMGLVSKGVNREFIDPELRTHLSYWEQELAGRDYFAGDEFTAADIQMSVPLEGAEANCEREDFPRIHQLAERLRDRDAYQRAVEKGGGLKMGW